MGQRRGFQWQKQHAKKRRFRISGMKGTLHLQDFWEKEKKRESDCESWPGKWKWEERARRTRLDTEWVPTTGRSPDWLRAVEATPGPTPVVSWCAGRWWGAYGWVCWGGIPTEWRLETSAPTVALWVTAAATGASRRPDTLAKASRREVVSGSSASVRLGTLTLMGCALAGAVGGSGGEQRSRLPARGGAGGRGNPSENALFEVPLLPVLLERWTRVEDSFRLIEVTKDVNGSALAVSDSERTLPSTQRRASALATLSTFSATVSAACCTEERNWSYCRGTNPHQRTSSSLAATNQPTNLGR